MLESQSFLISRALPSSCEQESEWIYMTYSLLERCTKPKRILALESELLHECNKDLEKKRKKSPPKLSSFIDLNGFGHESNGGGGSNHETVGGNGSSQGSDGSNGSNHEGNHESDGGNGSNRESDRGNGSNRESDGGSGSNHASDGSEPYSDLNSLINPIGRDNSINCLVRCSRSNYGSIASLNRGFRDLIRTGELYRLRRMMGITEHWVYFSCNVLEWEAYDPYRCRWINLPRMPHNECFMCSDKESLAVGTELLVFGKEVTSHVVLRYSILNNSWSPGVRMNSPRCLFGSASLGEKAIIAGGSDSHGMVLDTAELYNSETRTWTTLPRMNKPRKMCSGVFMDGKFYVIGGMVSANQLLTCGEEFDLEKGTWRVISNMSLGLNGASGAPPLVAVVNNELYAADYGQKEVRKYVKENNSWVTLGNLPDRPVSMNGWGLAFRACGERLIVIGGPRVLGGGMIELHSWVPKDEPPEWTMIASKHSGSFVYNCAVMGC